MSPAALAPPALVAAVRELVDAAHGGPTPQLSTGHAERALCAFLDDAATTDASYLVSRPPLPARVAAW